MEKPILNTGLFVSARVLRLMREKLELNITNRIKSLVKQTGLILEFNSAGAIGDDWEIVSAGIGQIQINPGMAILDTYEFVELAAITDAITIPSAGPIYYVLLLRLTDALTETWSDRDDQEKEKGTIEVVAGSLVLTGTNTAFDEIFEVGDRILLDATDPANQKELIIETVTDATHITVSATDADGDSVSFANESTIDFFHIGKYISGYPTSGDKNLLEHDVPAIVLTTNKASYSNYIEIGNVNYVAGMTPTIVDSRQESMMLLNEHNQKNTFHVPSVSEHFSLTPNTYGAGTQWIVSDTTTTGEHVIDDTIDYRDRLVHIQGYISEYALSENEHIPGAASYVYDSGQFTIDSAGAVDTTNSKNYFAGIAYFGAGGDTDVITIQNDSAEALTFYARASDGALCAKQTLSYYCFMAKIDYSAKLNGI